MIDADTDVVVAEFVTTDDPRAMTHALWMSNDGKTLYAVNSGTDEGRPHGLFHEPSGRLSSGSR